MLKKPPKYARQKPTGQARVRINGKSHYLRPHGSPESHKRYDALIAKWLNGTFDGDRESLTPDPRLHATTAVDRTFARISISRSTWSDPNTPSGPSGVTSVNGESYNFAGSSTP